MMGTEAIAAVIKKTVQESNRSFLFSYLDSSGLPHSCFMGFGHLNKNFSVVMLVQKNSLKSRILQKQSWIELVFNTKEYGCVAKFFGTVRFSSSPELMNKLVGAYAFLKEQYENPEEECMLVQLQTKLIEIEVLPEGKKWHTVKNYSVEDGALVEMEQTTVRHTVVEDEEFNLGRFDTVRRLITKRHGDMLMAVINHDFDQLSGFVSTDFKGSDGQDHNGFKAEQELMFKDLDFNNAEINWGIRNFEQLDDGKVSCQFFLDVTPKGEQLFSLKLLEQWQQENESWSLVSAN